MDFVLTAVLDRPGRIVVLDRAGRAAWSVL
jgi:hypothetical protein